MKKEKNEKKQIILKIEIKKRKKDKRKNEENVKIIITKENSSK